MNTTPNPFLLNWSQWLKIRFISLLVLALVVIMTYGHTLDVPFYLDDFSSIQEEPLIYNQGTFLALWQKYQWRIVGYLTFSFNYKHHQFQVEGYHIVNIFIHFLAGCALFGLLSGLVRTPSLNTVLSKEAQDWLPLVVTLIFLLHPLQIQSVTYIVQRLASLAALFYLSAMACFIQARLTANNIVQSLWVLACIFLTLLAFFTKQNTVSLPIALLLLELLFFHNAQIRFKGVITLLSIGIGLIIIVLMWDRIPAFQQSLLTLFPVLSTLDALTRETTEISRLAYFATQVEVLWQYIGLFFWSASSHIDYDNQRLLIEGFLYPNEHYHFIARLVHSEAFWALMGHLLLLGLALYSLRRWVLVAFGILFYYLAHSVESSVIPIRDVIFEHRTYLPNFGLALLCGWLLVVLLPRWLSLRLSLSLILIVLLVLGTATARRNQMWRDPVALWQHNVEQSPGQKRAWIILGKHLIQRGQREKEQGDTQKSRETIEQSIQALNKAISQVTRPDGSQSLSVTPETALNLVVAHKTLGQYEQALTWINRALALKDHLRPFDQAKFLVNQGNIFFELGHYNYTQQQYAQSQTLFQQSEAAYRQALQIYPQNLKARINLGSVLGMIGRIDEAIAIYQEVLAIEPSNAYVKTNLQKLFEMKNRQK